jgi:hypothetical protein
VIIFQKGKGKVYKDEQPSYYSLFILYQLKELQSITLIVYQHSHNHNIAQDQPNTNTTI